MDLRNSLNRYYYETTVSDLRHLSRTGGGELSFNSMMYLDVIAYQYAQGRCTVSTLADTLHITKSAVTLKINDLVGQGLVCKRRSETDRRVVELSIEGEVARALDAYERPFERAAQAVERRHSPEQIQTFCDILETFQTEYVKDF